jgi:putative SOS response-associated peptidase YedK
MHEGSHKLPFAFHHLAHSPLPFAGLWETWHDLDTLTIITTAANNGTVHFSDTVIRYVWSEPGEWPEAVRVQRVAAADQVQNDRGRLGVFEMKRDGALVAAVSPP